MTLKIEIDEDDLDESTIEAAIAANKEPLSLFRERLRAVADWSMEVDDGDREGALVYAVSEIIRTVDNVDDNGDVIADSSNFNTTESGKFDLREKTDF